MKTKLIVATTLALTALCSGCVVYPAYGPGYYGGGAVVVAPPPVVVGGYGYRAYGYGRGPYRY
jgi:hypothetical protein